MVSRTWFFTWNHYDDGDLIKLHNAGEFKYVYYGREIGQISGIPHLHGILVLKKPERLTFLKRVLGRSPHFELPNSSDPDSYTKWYNYCRKRDKQPYERDERQKRGPKKKDHVSRVSAAPHRLVSQPLKKIDLTCETFEQFKRRIKETKDPFEYAAILSKLKKKQKDYQEGAEAEIQY